MGSESSTDDPCGSELEGLRERMRVISEVTRRFAEVTTDYERLLESVARCLAETLHDSCIVFVLDEGGRALRAASMHAGDAATLEKYRQAFATRTLPLVEHPAMQHIMTSGRALLVPRLADRPESSAERARWEEALGLHSVMLVPLLVQGRAIGLVTLARYRAESPAFEAQDLELAQTLADHAGLAMENGRLFLSAEQARRAAEVAKHELSQSEHAQRHFFESSPMPGYVVDAETMGILAANAAAMALYGYSRDEFLRLTLRELRHPEEQDKLSGLLRAAGDMDIAATARHLRKDGSVIVIEGHSHLASFAGRPARFVMVSDQTQRLRTEQQLRQSQKMEAVGRLAGGIAHDFNNVLSVVLGYAEEIQHDGTLTQPVREGVEEIKSAAMRAAELTRQLLMFSRQQVLEPQVLDLNQVLSGVERMLGRVLGEHLQLSILPGAGLGRVFADRGNIEQVIMNLAVNARDAMPGGGRLTIETANVELDEAFAREHLDSKPGQYVFLGVTDTGAGMDQATRQRIFEPFFTTKELGKGTGLGLSTVLGIVQQSGGSIYVYSEPGRGTSFKVYLPRVQADTERKAPPAKPGAAKGGETVLLVEDEPGVRQVARRILERFGYAVLPASNAAEALALAEQHAGDLHLLLTDVVMPGDNGVQLAKQLTARRPDLKVLYMSGYTDGTIASQALDQGGAFLQKPFSADLLARKVRSVLDGSKA